MKKEKPTKFISENDAEAIYENIIKDLSCLRCGNKTFKQLLFQLLQPVVDSKKRIDGTAF